MSTIGSNSPSPAQGDAAAAFRKRVFEKLDRDADGKITREELAAGKPGKGRGPNVDQILAKADTNQDGAIDESENEAFLRKMHGHPGHPAAGQAAALARRILERVDTDASGQLSREELSNILGEHGNDSTLNALFENVDTDADGNLSRAELESALERMFEAMRERHGVDHEHPPAPGYNRAGLRTSDPQPDSQFSATA